jgi:hypothetical protein
LDVIRTQQGKRRYEFPRVWWHFALTLSAALAGAAYGLLTGEDLSFAIIWLGVWIAVGIILEATHRGTNFLMIHPTHLQYSERAWTPRAKRRRLRIRYQDIVDVKVDDTRPTITVMHRPESQMSRRLGIDQHRFSFALRSSEDAREVAHVLNAARAQLAHAWCTDTNVR